MKLNRWQLDRLYSLVAADVRRVADKRRELIDADDRAANDDSLRAELGDLLILKTKLDRLRKGHDMTNARRRSERNKK